MLADAGHEVYLYAAAESQGHGGQLVPTHTLKDIRQSWGSGDNRFEIGYDWKAEGFRHDFNKPPAPATLKFYTSAVAQIKARLKPESDFILVMQGTYHKPVTDNFPNVRLIAEPGIGYRGSFAQYRAFESRYLQNFTYGSEHPRQSINGHYYDRVIPNYYPEELFPDKPVDRPGDYFLFVGRLIDRKGIMTAVKATASLGARLIVAGQGDIIFGEDANGHNPHPHVEQVGYVNATERAELMKNARALFAPTIYLEAFGGVHAEAMLCGTPVITTDFGVFPETVIQGVTGWRCQTLADFVWAADRAGDLSRMLIWEYARQFTMRHVAPVFGRWFDDLAQLQLSYQLPNAFGWHDLELVKDLVTPETAIYK